MQESKGQQQLYHFFQLLIYFSIIVEVLVFLPPNFFSVDFSFLDRLRVLPIYQKLPLSKAVTFFIIILTSIGTKAAKSLEFNTTKKITIPIIVGIVMLISSILLYEFKFYTFYLISSFIFALSLHQGLNNLSKKIKVSFEKDRFNFENESFEQQKKKDDTPYSVNIPMRYYHKEKWNNGWINIVNPFRGTLLFGVPGCGKSFGIVEPFIRQHAAKGLMLSVYDFKFPTLTKVTYYQYLKAKKNGVIPENTKFNVVNFDQVEYSRRVNPIATEYISKLADATEIAEAMMEALQKGAKGNGSSDFFKEAGIALFSAMIYYLRQYENGKYCTIPHVLTLLGSDYEKLFTLLFQNEEIQALLVPFKSAFEKGAFDQLEGMAGTLRVQTARLVSKESFWVLSGNDFHLKISDKSHPGYLILANNPDTQSMNSAFLSSILTRFVKQVNSQGNLPCSIIIDELPTLYFYKVDNLIATARSNKVSTLLALQEMSQLEDGYGKIGAGKIKEVCGNIISGQARSNETLKWLEGLFGKIKQVKKNVSVSKDGSQSISYNEAMDFLIPASKIAELGTGWLVGSTSKDFIASSNKNILESDEFTPSKFFCKTSLDVKEIEKEEKEYLMCPKIYNFGDSESKNTLLTKNFRKIKNDIEKIIEKELNT